MITPQRGDGPPDPKFDSDSQTHDTIYAPRRYERVYYSYHEAFGGQCKGSSPKGPEMCR